MVILNGFAMVVKSQEIDSMAVDTVTMITVTDSVVWDDLTQLDSLFAANLPVVRPAFKPNPTKAVLYSAIFPGLGQIYNRKYWKLPIVYGGFMGFSYAVLWNNQNLQDYSEAYKDLTYDLINYPDTPENWHQSWRNFISASVDPAARFNENFRSQLKRGRDFYRRNRDLSIILTVGFYLICMADSYVDAQLFDFDISPDLSFHIEPVIQPGSSHSPRLLGLNCSFKF